MNERFDEANGKQKKANSEAGVHGRRDPQCLSGV